MPYEPTVWVVGDTITAAKLNKLESGVVAAQSLIVTASPGVHDFVLNKTWQEIFDAATAGIFPIVIFENTNECYAVRNVFFASSKYQLWTDKCPFAVNSSSGYPWYDNE